MRTVYLFSILVIYILLQFLWWSYLLVDLDNQVYEHRIENVYLKNADPVMAAQEEAMLRKKLHHRWWMVGGEGLVFLSLLTWGSVQTLRSFRRDMELARMQKNFLLSITHEFKSPLASIKLLLQTILKHPLDKEKQLSFINKAIADADRLDSLVENTLLANRVDHEGYKFNKEELNFSDVVRNTAAHFDLTRIELNIADEVPMYGDKLALALVVNNLLDNALKYSPEEEKIKVELIAPSSPKGEILSAPKFPLQDEMEDHERPFVGLGDFIFRVYDCGIGISDAEKKNVFRKFYRIGNEETRKTKGTGLGLYLVKYIVLNHGGTIVIGDNLPQGTIFEITFKST